MISIEIPGFGQLNLKYLVLDFNGTAARGGQVRESTARLVNRLSRDLKVFILTADTFGKAREACRDLSAEIALVEEGEEREAKVSFIHQLGIRETAAVGNGNNDQYMLEQAALGIAVLGEEGCSTRALEKADLLVKDVDHALEMLLDSRALKATLRF